MTAPSPCSTPNIAARGGTHYLLVATPGTAFEYNTGNVPLHASRAWYGHLGLATGMVDGEGCPYCMQGPSAFRERNGSQVHGSQKNGLCCTCICRGSIRRVDVSLSDRSRDARSRKRMCLVVLLGDAVGNRAYLPARRNEDSILSGSTAQFRRRWSRTRLGCRKQ